MKNIHVIPTSSPSKIFYIAENFHLEKGQLIEPKSYHNVYITSDEEIKEGDYIGYPTLNNWVPVQYLGGDLIGSEKKIILTTDQDLIKDGVQSIDDELLEWFIKNPTCEFVKIHKEKQHIGEEIDESYPKGFFDYKIIIPQEEPKQETLEEAAEKYKYNPKGDFCFTKGAKWQAERMYSEEDMFEFSQWISHEDWVYLPSKGYWVNEEQEELEQKLSSKEILNQWFEQFKKK
jgi:hypothetical protein